MRIRDAKSLRTVALPAAGAAAVTTSIDLLTPQAGPIGDSLQVEIEIPATPNLVNGINVTVELQHSSDDGGTDAFAAVATTGNMIVTGGTTGGGAAKFWRFYLPPNTKRYIRAQVSVGATGGDNTAKSLTLALAL